LDEQKQKHDDETLMEKIKECPSKRVREAMIDSLNKENNTFDKDA